MRHSHHCGSICYPSLSQRTSQSSSWKPDNYALARQDETAGHVKPDVYNLCSKMASKHGVDAGAEIAEFELANVDAVKNYVLENNVDCDLMITNAVDFQL
ncbi:hypothetical protein LB503_012025 [Fusarium chuoi]|nr:hypothetical protein LB503_012025 [Fusarium chuoi]